MTEKPTPSIYDYIICGGGCAGLSLAYQMSNSPELSKKKVLILEKEAKDENDRTWAFWEHENGPFQEIVHHQWEKAWFKGNAFSRLLDMEPYAYKIIKGDRFYAFVKGCLAKNPNITIVQTEVLSKVDGQDHALVNTTSGEFKGQFVFNSIPEKVEKKPNHNYLLQHFKGWWVKTKTPFFNPQEPTLMDFRIFQDGQCRFMYVLPVSEFEALVEFTIFSESHLEPEQYNIELEKYFLEYLNLEDFEIVHQEFGSIPMFSEAFPKKQGKRIFNIGTAGGQTKASTGYTFTRIQRHSRQLVQNLSQTGSPMVETGLFQSRFEWYDNVLLHVLARNVVGGAKVFQNLFKYNKPASIFRFLDEDSHFLNEYRIMNTVPILKFIGPGWKELMNLGK